MRGSGTEGKERGRRGGVLVGTEESILVQFMNNVNLSIKADTNDKSHNKYVSSDITYEVQTI